MSSERIPPRMGVNWQSMTPKELHEALSHTDPDVHAHEKSTFDPQEKLKSFHSVTDLVRKKENPGARHPYLNLFAENFETHVRSLSMPDLLQKLSELEKKAFEDGNEGALYQLKNYLKAVERIAFEDPSKIEIYNCPELHSAAILLSDDMIPHLRDRILKSEREHWTLEQFMDSGVAGYLEFLKSYDGKTFLFDHPYVKAMSPYLAYLHSRWSEEEITAASQKSTIQNHEKYNAILSRSLSRTTLRRFEKMPVEKLMRKIQEIQSRMMSSAYPNSSIMFSHWLFALGNELASRGQSMGQSNHQMVDMTLENYKKTFGPFLPEGSVERLRQPMLAAGDAYTTPLRLDNYKIRHDFMEGVRVSLQAVSDEKKSSMSEIQNDFVFNSFISAYGSLAKNMNIPFDAFDLMEIAAATLGGSGISFKSSLGDESRVTAASLTWAEIRNRGNVTLSWNNYPQSEDWLEDEVSVFKKIQYQGLSLYDLAQPVLDTVTLSQYGQAENSPAGHAIGTARELFKHIDLEYTDESGNMIPFHERLYIMAHEVFHNLQGARILNGITTGISSSSLIIERDTFLFGAYVLEEYLKLRLVHSYEKSISQREIDDVSQLIAWCHLVGSVSNGLISKMDPGFDEKDMSVELPMKVHWNLDLFARDAMEKHIPIGEVFSIYPSHGVPFLKKVDERLEQEKEGVKERLGVLFDPKIPKIPLEPEH